MKRYDHKIVGFQQIGWGGLLCSDLELGLLWTGTQPNCYTTMDSNGTENP